MSIPVNSQFSEEYKTLPDTFITDNSYWIPVNGKSKLTWLPAGLGYKRKEETDVGEHVEEVEESDSKQTGEIHFVRES